MIIQLLVVSPINANSLRLLVALSIVTAVASTRASGEDVVVVSKANGTGTTRIVGTVIDRTGRELKITRSNGRQALLDGHRVREVHSTWNSHHVQADQHFERGDYSASLTSYRQAFEAEQRNWVKRRIAAQLVWCFRYLDQMERAADAFLWLYRSDPSTHYLPAIPLAWTADPARVGLYQKKASGWLASDSHAAQLIAASWLLSTVQRGEAIRVLEGMDDPDSRIVYLAEAQLWRTRIGTAEVVDITNWQQRLTNMPATIRAGPYYTLGQAWSQRKQHKHAALTYLRVPIHYARHRRLSAHSLIAAGRELEKLHQVDSAVPLYREVVVDYPELPAADDAQRQILRIQSQE